MKVEDLRVAIRDLAERWNVACKCPTHKPLRHPFCELCNLNARIEELADMEKRCSN